MQQGSICSSVLSNTFVFLLFSFYDLLQQTAQTDSACCCFCSGETIKADTYICSSLNFKYASIKSEPKINLGLLFIGSVCGIMKTLTFHVLFVILTRQANANQNTSCWKVSLCLMIKIVCRFLQFVYLNGVCAEIPALLDALTEAGIKRAQPSTIEWTISPPPMFSHCLQSFCHW